MSSCAAIVEHAAALEVFLSYVPCVPMKAHPASMASTRVRSAAFLRVLQEGGISRDGLRLANQLRRQPGGGRGDAQFIRQVNVADRRIVRVDRRQDATLQKQPQRVRGIAGNRAGLDVARQARFNADAPFREHIEQGRVMRRARPMPDALGAVAHAATPARQPLRLRGQ